MQGKEIEFDNIIDNMKNTVVAIVNSINSNENNANNNEIYPEIISQNTVSVNGAIDTTMKHDDTCGNVTNDTSINTIKIVDKNDVDTIMTNSSPVCISSSIVDSTSMDDETAVNATNDTLSTMKFDCDRLDKENLNNKCCQSDMTIGTMFKY